MGIGTTECLILLLDQGIASRAALRKIFHDVLRDVQFGETGSIEEVAQLLEEQRVPRVVCLDSAFAHHTELLTALRQAKSTLVKLSTVAMGTSPELTIDPPFHFHWPKPEKAADLKPLLRKISALQGHWHDSPHPLRRQTDSVLLNVGSKVKPVLIQEIISIASLGNSCQIESDKGSGGIPRSLKFFEQALDPAQFIRVGKSHIINLKRIASFRSLDNGCVQVELRNGTSLVVSRRRASDFRQKLKAALVAPASR